MIALISYLRGMDDHKHYLSRDNYINVKCLFIIRTKKYLVVQNNDNGTNKYNSGFIISIS